MDILEQRIIKGRKNHKCALCGLTIEKGEEHTLQVVVDAGEFARHRWHFECERMTKIWEWTWHEWENNTDYSEFLERMTEYKESQKGIK